MGLKDHETVQDVIDCILYSTDKTALLKELKAVTDKHKPPTYTNKQGIRVILPNKKHFEQQSTL